MKAGLALGIACAVLVATGTANASSFVVTLEQVADSSQPLGFDVVASSSGDIDIAGLNYFLTGSAYSAIGPDTGYTFLGSESAEYDGYDGATITGPSNFGSGSTVFASTGSMTFVSTGAGDPVGINLPHTIYVPHGYVSGNALSDSAAWDNATFASLGITPGSYTWTWGSSPDQSFTLDVLTSTPLPAALPLFVTGFGALGLLGRRRNRKAVA